MLVARSGVYIAAHCGLEYNLLHSHIYIIPSLLHDLDAVSDEPVLKLSNNTNVQLCNWADITGKKPVQLCTAGKVCFSIPLVPCRLSMVLCIHGIAIPD